MRVTAESVSNNWALSTGKVQSFKLPCGNGIRVDTALETGQAIGSDFDSLLAKIIITAPSWSIVVQKAQRALADTYITGVKTNLNILRGIIAHPEFASRDCDTRWLEENQEQLLQLGERVGKAIPAPESNELASTAVGALAAPLFRKGDAWTVNLTPLDNKIATSMANHLQITRVLRNDFPASLVADVNFTGPSGTSQPFKLELASTSASASAVTSHHRRGDAANPNHIIFPFPGKLVEVLVDEGDVIKPEDVVCVVQQMKMEIEIRAKRGGRVVWVTEAEDGEDVNEGLLAAEIVEVGDGKLAKL